MARGEPIAANTAIAAAAKNNEQNIRRHGNGVKVPFDFVIIESPKNVLIFVFIRVGFVASVFTEVLEKIRREVTRKVVDAVAL